MIPPAIPPDEEQRLEALKAYEILDTLPESVYDDLTALAAHICQTPIALVSLVDRDRQWFKSRLGLDASETPRDISFCGHVVADRETLIVPDAQRDERFADNPLVTGEPGIRFYAGAPLATPDQHYVGTLCVIDSQPHTLGDQERGLLEALSRQVVSQLELRLNLRNLESTQEELRQAILSEREASQAKSLFLANMSHELRTPLNAVIGYSEMLQEEAEDAGQESFVDDLGKIRSSGEHLLGLINDILDLSKIEAGKLILERESFGLAELLAETTPVVEPLVAKNGNVLKVHVRDPIDRMEGDRSRTRQCLLNLLSNAAKFTENGTIALEVRRATLGEQSAIAFSVEDTGIGIAPEDLERVFGRFEQVSRKSGPKHAGTGIGLPLTRHLAVLMGGDVTAESEPGGGSMFTLVLPTGTDREPG